MSSETNIERLTTVQLLLLMGIVLLGAALRLYDLGGQSLWFDEGATLEYASNIDSAGSLFDISKTNEPPMIAVLTFLWLRFLDTVADAPVISAGNDFLIRLLPCVFGILCIPLVFLAARALLRHAGAALVAAFLFAIAPFHIYYAQELRVYTVYTALSLCALYCLVNALQKDRRRYWAGLALAEALLLYSHFISVWTIFLFNGYFLCVLPRHYRLFWKWTAAQAAAAVLALPALWHLYNALAQVSRIEIAWYAAPTWKTGLLTFKAFFAGYSFCVWAYWALFLLAALLFILGLALLIRQWHAALFIALLAVVPIAANIVIWKGRHFSFYEHRPFIFSGVVALIAIAWVIAALRPRALGWAALALFTALTMPHLRELYAHRVHPVEMHRLAVYDKPDFRSAAAYIRGHFQNGDLICHPNHFTMYSMRHYLDLPQTRICAHDWDRDVMVQSHGNPALTETHGLMPVRMEQAVRDARRVWFLESRGLTFEYKPHTEPVRAWLDANFQRVDCQPFFGLTVTCYARYDGAPPRAPNVVFLLLDTVRADHAGAARNGKPITPHLDAFAKGAAVFTNTVTPCSWTKPAMASIFTSLYVDAHKVFYSARNEDPEHPVSDVLPEAFETMAEWLAAAGYETFGVQTNANLTRVMGFAQGFDEGRYVFENGWRADWVTQQALYALDELREPFFAYFHYMDPHAPYDPPGAYRTFFGPEPDLTDQDRALLENETFMAYCLDRVKCALGLQAAPAMPDFSPQGKEYVRTLYDSEIRFMDDQLGPLLDRVQAKYPHSIIVIASDHGEEFWERGGMGHGATLYQEQIRVPLLIRAPGLAPGPVDTPAELVDILPTIAGLLGREPDPAWQGTDLFRAGLAHEPRFSRTYGPWQDLYVDAEAAVQGEMKLVSDNARAVTQLFDLAADPRELANHAMDDPGRTSGLAVLLDAHRAANQAIGGAAATQQMTLDDETRALLDSVGYIDSRRVP
ncbi:MAG: sulfatase-like hydrolase/transferase [Candidatus Hydrogenedentes bacterium]|nr:sulfatase-like hydrolase/transferase [Candidatus Hydrogenedentota bacterium]